MSQIQATRSDGENPQVKAQAEGGGREKRLKQKQGTKRIPKTRVHSTLCKAISQPTLTTEELQFYSWSRELMIFFKLKLLKVKV